MHNSQLDHFTPRQRWLPIVALFLLLTSVIIKSAWLGDDAYIGFRSIDNLLNGHGLRWNINERVQVFTDPLKLLLLAVPYAITNEIFITAVVFCIVASLAAVFVLVNKLSVSLPAAAASLAALLSSKAWIDYSTSGLENPLNYLLVALFCVPFLRQPITRRSLRLMIVFYAFIGFNRLDLLLMLFPAMAYGAWTAYRTRAVTFRDLLVDGLIFSAPLWAWLLFSAIYFGYAFPNTYYAKLYTGIPLSSHVAQGLMYYINSIDADPLTLLVIAFAISVVLLTGNIKVKVGAVGLILYLLYVVKIGGDFMSGRFFSVPFFYAVVLLAQLPLRRSVWISLAVLWFVIGFAAPYPTFLYNEHYRGGHREQQDPEAQTSAATDRRGIADERGNYYSETGLLPVITRKGASPIHGWARSGKRARKQRLELVAFSTHGLFGFYAGPGVHIIDPSGLGDPLTSRLPIYDAKNWRVGHYERSIPKGYVETLRSGVNELEDPHIKELYRVAKILTRDPIWSWERFGEILKANLGYYKAHGRAAPRLGSGPPIGFGDPVIFAGRDFHDNVYQYNTVVSFARGGNSERYRRSGWSHTEQRFTWSDGPAATLVFPVRASVKPLELQMRAAGHVRPPEIPSQAVEVMINGEKIAEWEVASDQIYTARIPAHIALSNALAIQLNIPNAFAPDDTGSQSDSRRLGLLCQWTSIVELKEPTADEK